MKQRSVRPGEQTAVFDPSTAKWLIETVQRLAEKLDNATGFAENGPRTLAAHPPQRPGRANYVNRPADLRLVRVSSNATGGGVYNGWLQSVDDSWTFNPSTAYSLSGRYNDASQIYIVSMIDSGTPARHSVPFNSYHWARKIGTHSDNRDIYEIIGIAWACTP